MNEKYNWFKEKARIDRAKEKYLENPLNLKEIKSGEDLIARYGKEYMAVYITGKKEISRESAKFNIYC